MRRPIFTSVLLLATVLVGGCGNGSTSDGLRESSPKQGKADGLEDVADAHKAPDWLLAVDGYGTWTEPDETDNAFEVIHGWVDARVQNRRFDKRVMVEVAYPYGDAVMRTLHPARFKSDLGGGHENWGTDTVEIYPDGGPHGTDLSGPVMFRLRMQEDPDNDGQDQMVVTGWSVLYGDGDAWWPIPDPWAPGWASPERPSGEEPPLPEVLYTPFDDGALTVVAQIERVIAAKLANPEERHTIHAAIFNINDPRIVDRLIAAHQVGVEVLLVTEGRKLSPEAYWQTEDDRLLSAGVPLLGVRRAGRGAMHNKFVIFDGRVLATGSFNWEVGSSMENHENMLVTEEPELIAAYARRFETLAGQVQRPRYAAHEPAGTISVSFAPDEEPHRIMGDLIDQASDTLHIAMFTCKNVEYEVDGQTTSLFDKLAGAVGRGVEVIVITDYGIAEAAEYFGVMSEDDPMDEYLETLGVKVVLADNTFGQYSSMHHKFTVVDRQVAVTGAFNWYYDAAYLNDEDQLVWRNELLAADFAGEFVDLLRRYDPDYEAGHWPRVNLHFALHHEQTAFGDTVVLVGDLPELGSWDPNKGIALDGGAWPTWLGSLELPAGIRLEYKFATIQAGGGIIWHKGQNRTLRVPTDTTEMHIDAGNW